MKVPVEWLQSCVDLSDVAEEELARALTMAGLEVENIHGEAYARVLVTKVTPNRGDWMSIIGVAREAAAALDRPFQAPNASAVEPGGETAKLASVEVADSALCPRYGLRIVRNVKNVSSPDYIQRRITQAGMRSLGIVVDVANYVMLELGQPLHAFDSAAIPAGKIIVRPANFGETITTLDEVKRTLPEGTLVIADSVRPIAIAGVMGGYDSQVNDETDAILLESAHFDPGTVRRGAKALGLSTEASYRFERFVDPALVPIALDMATSLLAKHAGAEVVGGIIDTNPSATAPRSITLRPERVNAILGEMLTIDQIVGALARLNLPALTDAKSAGTLTVTTPSFRPDIVREIDLIEEIGRMIGYETLAETLPPARGEGGRDAPKGIFESRLRALLVAEGMVEAFTHTLTSASPFDDPAIAANRVRIRLALSAELSGLRQSLLPNLLDVMALNARHRQPQLRMFEVGKVFAVGGPGNYTESRSAAGVLTGGDVSYLTAKGIVERLMSALHLSDVRYVSSSRHAMHPGRCADVIVGGKTAGYVAEADPDLVKAKLDVPASIGRVAYFELDSDFLGELADRTSVKYQPQPKFPALSRDLALVFDRQMPYGEIEAAARVAAGSLLAEISLLSVYTGEKVAADKKSVAVRLVLRSPERTLVDADADGVLHAVQTALAGLGGEAR